MDIKFILTKVIHTNPGRNDTVAGNPQLRPDSLPAPSKKDVVELNPIPRR